jgi:hypothetical protein
MAIPCPIDMDPNALRAPDAGTALLDELGTQLSGKQGEE